MDLEGLGLTKTESKVYIALFEEGDCLASNIIKKLQFHRATVYDVLNRLIEKGLASYTIKDKKKYYKAADPKKFLEIISEKKENIKEEERKAENIIKEFNKIIKKETHSYVESVSGKEGLKNLMSDLLKTKEFLIFGGEVKFKEYLPIYTIHWAKEREKRGVYAKILTNFKVDSQWPYNKYKILAKSLRFPVSTIVYGHCVALILPEEPISIVIIKSEKTAEAYKSVFEILWNGKKSKGS